MAVEHPMLLHLEELNIEDSLASHVVVKIATTYHVLSAMRQPETQY